MSNVCQINVDITIDTLDTLRYTLDIHVTNIEHKSMEMIMATSNGWKATTGQSGRNYFSTFSTEHTCGRCGGLLVQDFCTDLLNSTGELDCSTARCVQCGDVVDPVIQRNRHLQRTAGTVQDTKASVSSIHSRCSV